LSYVPAEAEVGSQRSERNTSQTSCFLISDF